VCGRHVLGPVHLLRDQGLVGHWERVAAELNPRGDGHLQRGGESRRQGTHLADDWLFLPDCWAFRGWEQDQNQTAIRPKEDHEGERKGHDWHRRWGRKEREASAQGRSQVPHVQG